jgi:uncharacterized repeat protein (TIGR03803 family)
MKAKTQALFHRTAGTVRRVVTACFIALILAFAPNVKAQTLVALHTFTELFSPTNSDGATPLGGLILSGNTLYGTASGGGTGGYGTLFKINTDGTGFATLYNFSNSVNGSGPAGNLLLLDNTLYGATKGGATYNAGTLFSFNLTNGYSMVHLFQGNASDGGYPSGSLIFSGVLLYGTTQAGTNGVGTVFGVSTNGLTFTNLINFDLSEASTPDGGLILSSNILYGTAAGGGANNYGTVFAINTNGMGFTNLHNFDHIDGSYPEDTSSLILSGNTLYGTTYYGGTNGDGSVFAINTDGTGFTNLYSFDYFDGDNPASGLILSGNTLYGTTWDGGFDYGGTVFAINTDGTGFTNLYNFTGGYDGENPVGSLVLSGNTLYGTTQYGATGEGTVFSLTLGPAPPQLTIALSGSNVILTWPTNAAGFTLEFATNLAASAWNTNLPAPVVVSGQNTVTNAISNAQQFYRLIEF